MAKTIKQRCEEIGISLPTYYLRIKNGMTPEEALSTPNMRRNGVVIAAPKPAPEPEDQEPRAPLTIKSGGKTACVFEEDHQERQRQIKKQREEIAKAKNASAALLECPGIEDEETEKVDNYEYVNLKPLRYGPVRHKENKPLEPQNWSEADETRFNNACGGYVATILNHTKDGEFKYQIYSTNTKKKLYTNDVVRFINQIIKICDPEGKTPFRVIER